jgi:hypothetical protein
LLEEGQGRRDGNGRTMVSAHAVDGNFNCHLWGVYRDSHEVGGKMHALFGAMPVSKINRGGA